ncbi:restriction endonuclease subunit S [Chloroflexota bacterium]
MWTNYKLSQICTITSSKRIFASEYVESGVPFWRGQEIQEMKNGNTQIRERLYISEEKYYELKKMYGVPSEGDILLSSVGTLGTPYQVKKNDKFYFKDGNLTWFKNFKQISNSTFLYYWMQSKYFIVQIKNNKIGAVQSALTIDFLNNYVIYLPDRTEQDRIAAFLSLIDSKIENNNRIITELESLAKLIYDYWFVQFDFPNNNDKPYKSSGGKMIWNEKLKREIPEGLVVLPLPKCCDIIDCLHSKKPDRMFEDEKYYLLQLENLVDMGIVDLSNKYYVKKEVYKLWTSRIEVKHGDLVVTNAGRVGSIARIPGNVVAGIGRNITAIRPLKVPPVYLYYFFNSSDIRGQIKVNTDSGSFFGSLNVKGIKELVITTPDEQCYDVLSKFEEIASPMREQIESTAQENFKLTRLRDWLLPMLMNGQVTIK